MLTAFLDNSRNCEYYYKIVVIRKNFHSFLYPLTLPSVLCLQCFDTVGWAAGRASGLLKTMVGCWHGICLEWGADLHIAQLMPVSLTTSCSSKSRLALNRMVLLFWCWLTRVVREKRPLNKFSSFVSFGCYFNFFSSEFCVLENLIVSLLSVLLCVLDGSVYFILLHCQHQLMNISQLVFTMSAYQGWVLTLKYWNVCGCDVCGCFLVYLIIYDKPLYIMIINRWCQYGKERRTFYHWMCCERFRSQMVVCLYHSVRK